MKRGRKLRPRGQEVRYEAPIAAGFAPPNDLDAEAYCLEACLNSVERRADVLELLRPKHFYSDSNSFIFEAVVDLSENSRAVDVMSVSQWLDDHGKLERAGGKQYVAQIGLDTASKYYIRPQAQRVVEMWRRRQLIATCQRIAAEGYGEIADTKVWLDTAEQEVYNISHQDEPGQATRADHIVKAVFEELKSAERRGDGISGTPTGLDALDRKTSGLHDGDLYIVAGRPGMGKSACVGDIVLNVASPREVDGKVQPGDAVAMFSLEMPKEQFMKRMICSWSKTYLTKMRNYDLHDGDWAGLTQASRDIASLPIWIDETPAIDLLTIRSRLRRIEQERPRAAQEGKPSRRLGLVVIDYLQLMKGRDDAPSREQEISEISRGLKQLAKEFKVPVIALSQLNRAVETRNAKDKRPQLSDLRESGAIEQDADVIIFVYRPWYYDNSFQPEYLTELIVAKQRNGPTGKVYVRFDAAYSRFGNLDPSEVPQDDE